MQKKIKSRLAEIFFVLFCLSGSTLSVWKFWQDLNKSLFKFNEEPIATISFKYKTAQRKFIDDVLWDRLRQDSPVYEGDTIRTAPLSEATIYFSDGNIMDLHENTMARLSLKEDGAEIDFEGGQITVQANNSAIKIKTGSSIVDVSQGAQVAAAASTTEDKAFHVQVSKGNANLSSDTGTVVLTEGAVAELDAEGKIQKNYLSVSYPSSDEKFLNLEKTGYRVPFNWELDSEVSEVVLEIFDSKEMSDYSEKYTYSGTNTANVILSSGTHWWKLSVKTPQEGEEEAYTGKINIIQSGAPTLIAPAVDYSASYRMKTPSTRFIWTDVERATSYQLEISKNSDMSNPLITQRSSQTSSIISSLEAGIYYWRVIPYFAMNGIGLAAPSTVQSFEIKKSGVLEKPVLQVPASNAVVSTKVPLDNGEVSFKSIHFSWKDNPEATRYKIRFWPQSNSNNAITQDTTSNHFEIDTKKTEIANGKWMWQVTTYDVEGNEAVSDVRELYAMDSNVELRTIYPPDNYYLAESRVADIRYIWKSNLPFDSELQIARDTSFESIVYKERTSNTSAGSRALNVGTYYWRIVTDLGDSTIETKAKTLYVAPPLAAPVLDEPVGGRRAIIRPQTPLEFKWKTVSGADYYQLKIYEADKPDVAVYDKNFIESADGKTVSEKVYMDDYEEKNYLWTVQAFREETLTASRQAGYLEKGNFNLKKLTPIKLISPGVEDFDGIEMVKNPGTFKWYSVYEREPVTIVIYKGRMTPDAVFKKINVTGLQTKMPVLYEGNYYWTVQGTIDDGELDISSTETRYFTVGRIPKLEASKKLSPSNKTFDMNYFRNSREIKFEWDKVKEADYYVLTLYDPEGNVIGGKSQKLKENSFVLDDLSILKKGDFSWTIEAQTEYNGNLFQHGEVASATFEIDLPEIKKVNVKNSGKMYGK